MHHQWWAAAALALACYRPSSVSGSSPLSSASSAATAADMRKIHSGEESAHAIVAVEASLAGELPGSMMLPQEMQGVGGVGTSEAAAEGSSRNASEAPKGGRKGANDPASTVEGVAVREVSLWDVAILFLLALFALLSSGALLAGGVIGDLGRRSCMAWGPLRRFMRLRSRSNVKLQMLVSQYERVSQERSRIAPLWFVAKQTRDKRELASLKKQAYQAEKTLASIRRRYAEERAESGFFRQLSRFISSGAWAEDQAPSSGMSDSSVVSDSTVESLLHQRIQAQQLQSSNAESEPASESDGELSERGRIGVGFQMRGEASRSNPGDQAEEGSENYSRSTQGSPKSPPVTDCDDTLPSEVPGYSHKDNMMFYKLEQLSQRKIASMRRVVQETTKQGTSAGD